MSMTIHNDTNISRSLSFPSHSSQQPLILPLLPPRPSIYYTTSRNLEGLEPTGIKNLTFFACTAKPDRSRGRCLSGHSLSSTAPPAPEPRDNDPDTPPRLAPGACRRRRDASTPKASAAGADSGGRGGGMGDLTRPWVTVAGARGRFVPARDVDVDLLLYRKCAGAGIGGSLGVAQGMGWDCGFFFGRELCWRRKEGEGESCFPKSYTTVREHTHTTCEYPRAKSGTGNSSTVTDRYSAGTFNMPTSYQ